MKPEKWKKGKSLKKKTEITFTNTLKEEGANVFSHKVTTAECQD